MAHPTGSAAEIGMKLGESNPTDKVVLYDDAENRIPAAAASSQIETTEIPPYRRLSPSEMSTYMYQRRKARLKEWKASVAQGLEKKHSSKSCLICRAGHFVLNCPYRWRCPPDLEVPKLFVVCCVNCGADMIDGRCSNGCYVSEGHVVEIQSMDDWVVEPGRKTVSTSVQRHGEEKPLATSEGMDKSTLERGRALRKEYKRLVDEGIIPKPDHKRDEGKKPVELPKGYFAKMAKEMEGVII